jgi:hypothetical protein
MPQLRFAWLSLPLLLGGCCYFTPCHPGTYIAGAVTDSVSSQAIPNASIRLYHYETHSVASGCFALGGPDARPFEFGISAPGYKPVVVEATPGSYQATVTLAPVGSSGNSTSTIREISRERYAELSRGCP